MTRLRCWLLSSQIRASSSKYDINTLLLPSNKAVSSRVHRVALVNITLSLQGFSVLRSYGHIIDI